MHELSLAASVVEIVLRHAAGRRVTKVEIEVGRLRQVVPSALTFSFEMVAMGTVAEGAALEIRNIPAKAECRRCSAVSVLEGFPLQCASCGSFDLTILAGEELVVAFLELEERERGEYDENSGDGGNP
jgi:hydrogenase nickel incorporation protein HypA/HybF